MIRSYYLLPLVLFAACSHDTGHDLDSTNRNDSARTLLAAADFVGARNEYAAVRAVDPNNAEAAFGWALSDLLLMPDSAPVTELLGRCNQTGFNVGRDIFGPNGVLAQEEAALAGTAQLTVHARQNATAGASDLRFAPDAVKVENSEYKDLSNVTHRRLYISVRERSDEPRWFHITVNIDDVERNDADTTPLAAGVTVNVADIDGEVSFYVPTEFGGWYSNVYSGQIVFNRVGTNIGDPISIELRDVFLPATCPQSPCDSRYEIRGTIEDTLTARPDIDEESLPFGTIDDEPGPPHRDGLIVAIDLCSRPFSTGFIADKVQQLGDLLQADSEALQVVINSPDATSFNYVLPRRLLHSRVDLSLSLTDVLALKAMVDAAAAFADLGAQYSYLQGDLQDLISEYDIWVDNGGAPIPRRERGMSAAALAMALDVAYLDREPTFNLDTFRTRLEASLTAAAAALRNNATQPGMLNFQTQRSKRLADEIADGVDAMRASIQSQTPVPLPSAPLFQFGLGRFFASPLDQDRLEALSGINPLWQRIAGDPNATTASGRNDELQFTWGEELFAEDTNRFNQWTDNVFVLPLDRSDTDCSNDPSICGAGYMCGTGQTCQVVMPYLASEVAWEGAIPDEWPVFVDPRVRDAFDFGF